ncbi:hypothetical protein E2C01_092479 [Portunus trituberculatus]|uniref:Uncharacterized protein n=1 Tax=Portunus trituberculatus TaxID=210409 RepID=A0A5B7JK75_PORTR|nr:hypothetical protein [Portunus trituberculatus]
MMAQTEGEADPSSVSVPLKSSNFYPSGMLKLPAALAYSRLLKAQVLTPGRGSSRNKSGNIKPSHS